MVRGIGVAESVSTSILLAQVLELLLVPHAEALLLVDDHQAQVLWGSHRRESKRCVPMSTSIAALGETP